MKLKFGEPLGWREKARSVVAVAVAVAAVSLAKCKTTGL